MDELGMPSTFSTSTIKIAASLPLLLVLHMVSRNPDWTIRYKMALGALSEKLALHGFCQRSRQQV
jgi:hypothetical protein